MIYFSFRSIILSIIYALIYGAIFGFVINFIKQIPLMLKYIVSIPKALIIYTGPLNSVTYVKKYKKKPNVISRLYVFFSIIIFSLGFLFLSYYAIDGELRLYLLLFSFLGIKASCSFILFINFTLLPFKKLIYMHIVFLRIIFYPIKLTVYFTYKKYIIVLTSLEKRIPKFKEIKG